MSEGSEGRPESLTDSSEGSEGIVLLVIAKKGYLGSQTHRPGSLSTLPLPYLSVNVRKLFVCRFWFRGACFLKRMQHAVIKINSKKKIKKNMPKAYCCRLFVESSKMSNYIAVVDDAKHTF